jgi:hypothetical protein
MSNDTVDSFHLDFVVAGFSKCGTTSLCDLLSRHPDICIANEKEPYFFCADDFEDSWPWYLELYSHRKPGQLCGEGSTYYSNIDHEVRSRENLANLYPRLKTVFVVRNPFDRLESSYKEMHHRGPEFGFDACFPIRDILRQQSNMLDDTRYWTRLKNYLDFFPENQVHIIFLEDLKANSDVVVAECMKFLEVDTTVNLEYIKLNSGAEKLYDSGFLRILRRSTIICKCLNLLSPETYNRVLKLLLLRKSFKNSIEWDVDTRKYIVDKLGSDVSMLLSYCGKLPNFWGDEWI